MLLSTKTSEKKPKSVSMWKDFGFFGSEICEFNIEKVKMPENTLFYVNQGYQSYKDNKKVYYNDIFIIAQIMPFLMNCLLEYFFICHLLLKEMRKL